MKFLIYEDTGLELPIVFCDVTTHSTMANMINKKIVSAGFCSVVDGNWVAYGDSISLGLKARKEDSNLIDKMMKFRC